MLLDAQCTAAVSKACHIHNKSDPTVFQIADYCSLQMVHRESLLSKPFSSRPLTKEFQKADKAVPAELVGASPSSGRT